MIPEFSVIIPFYNGADTLAAAIKSVFNQNFPVEIIVVDDGSEVSPLAALSESGGEVKLARIPHSGKAAAVNAGAKIAQGEFVCVLDQDDLMLSGRLSAQAAALKAAPSADGVYSDYERRQNGKLIDVFKSRQADPEEMLHALASDRRLFSIQTLTLRKTVFSRLGGFCADPRLNGLDDAEFFLRLLCSRKNLKYVPGVFGCWVSHGGNYSKSRAFQDARLAFLERAESLSGEFPVLKKEIPFLAHHCFYMRGLFFLENGEPRRAIPEFAKAAMQRPFSANTVYLLVKSFFKLIA